MLIHKEVLVVAYKILWERSLALVCMDSGLAL